MRHLLVLNGQSNIVGVNNGLPAPTYSNLSRIFMYTQPWNSTYGLPLRDADDPGLGTWQAAADPLHADPACGVGPGIAAASRWIDNLIGDDPNVEIGIVPCGWGGSNITPLNDPNARWASRLWRYDAFGMMAARVNAAKSWADGRIAAVYYQGETDAKLSPAPQWHIAVSRYMLDFNTLFGSDTLHVITRLGPYPGAPHISASWASIQNQANWMKGVMPNMAVVDAGDLTAVPGDWVHLTAASCVTLGERYGDAIAGLMV